MPIEIVHLFEAPEHRAAVASLIHEAFWVDMPGASTEKMAERLSQAAAADKVPLCLVAVADGQLIGAVNLVESDDELHTEWSPWLAGMVVAPSWRGQGVGSQLVRALLDDARRLGFAQVYFGTDGPAFYTRLGAVEAERVREDFWFMRFELEATSGR